MDTIAITTRISLSERMFCGEADLFFWKGIVAWLLLPANVWRLPDASSLA